MTDFLANILKITALTSGKLSSEADLLKTQVCHYKSYPVIHTGGIKKSQMSCSTKVQLPEKMVYYFTSGVPKGRTVFPATSFRMMAAIMYQAENAQTKSSYPATLFHIGSTKWPKSKNMNPSNNVKKVTAIALCIRKEATDIIAVYSVQPTK